MISEGNPQQFTVGRTRLAGAFVFSPNGSLTFEDLGDLRGALDETSDEPRPRVVIDCRQVAVMDSEALELLLEWHAQLAAAGGTLTLTNLNDVCADILTVTRLVHTLNVAEDIGAAVKDE